MSSVGCRHPHITAYPCSALQASGCHARPHPSRERERGQLLLQQPHSPSRTRHHSCRYLGCKQTIMPTQLPEIGFIDSPMRNFTLHRPTQHGLNHMVKGGLVKDSCPSLKHFLRARTEHQTMIHQWLQLCFL